MMKSRTSIVLFLILTVAFATRAGAQTNGLDNNFGPIVTQTASIFVTAEDVQPDGKIIAAGDFTIVNGQIHPAVVRLNTDGSVDPSFTCTVCTFNVSSLLIQPDGRVVLAGSEAPNGFYNPRFIRLNSDGSLDGSFAFPFTGQGVGERFANVLAIQADGKIYATLFSSAPQTASRTLYRINPDGARDTGFTTLTVNERPASAQRISGVTVMPDGRVFVYGFTPYGYLNRLNADGTKDTTFEEPTLTFPVGNLPANPQRPFISSFGEQSDGKLVITGQFDTVNAIEKNRAARLNTNGGVDTAYDPQPSFLNSLNRIIKIYPGDKALMIRNDAPKKIIRYNPDGTVDNSYSAPDELTNVSRAKPLAGDQLLVFGTYNGTNRYIRLNGDGSVDPSFTSPAFEREGSVKNVFSLPGGKTLIQGVFDKVNGTPRAGFARLNADGSLDPAFDPGTGIDSGAIYEFAVQSDGKVLAVGPFNTYNGVAQPWLIRLNTNGSVDTGFAPHAVAEVFSVAVRPDGKILVGGSFAGINTVTRPRLALLNSDGSLDNSFTPSIGTIGDGIRSLILQSDGKIMIAGIFSGANGFNRNNLARLNADGTTDTSFNYTGTGFIVYVSQLPDGKYLVQGGNGGLKRLTSTGAVDSTFTQPTVGYLDAILPGPGGTVLIGGDFTSVNGTPKNHLARLLPDGSLDILFNPNGANKRVWSMSAQKDGKVVVGGDFTRLGDVDRINVGRLLNAAAAKVTPFDFDGDGRADVSVTRPGDFNWYQLRGVGYNFSATQFGQPGDKVTPGDYDGDGKTDLGIFRPAAGDWWYLSGVDGLQHGVHWGQNGDTPLTGDYDGDGNLDLVAIRNYTWWIANRNGQIWKAIAFGQAGDKPLIGDFDGDGKTDPAVYRPSEGNWYYAASSNNGVHTGFHWGLADDIPVPADYDGDGKTDAAVFRPSEGNWYVLSSSDGNWIGLHFGLNGDKPVAADYDGDGKADIAVYRPSDHYWYFLTTTQGFYGFPFGLDTDIPAENAYVPQ